jgi:hypothetical protein
MLKTKVLYAGVHVHLDTDDPSLVERFEYQSRWDAPLLKIEKEKKSDVEQTHK